MKIKFRILEIADDEGVIRYNVQQLYCGCFWSKSRYSELSEIYPSYEGELVSYRDFKNMKAVREALEQVKVVMSKKSKAYKKVVEVVTIEVP